MRQAYRFPRRRTGKIQRQSTAVWTEGGNFSALPLAEGTAAGGGLDGEARIQIPADISVDRIRRPARGGMDERTRRSRGRRSGRGERRDGGEQGQQDRRQG